MVENDDFLIIRRKGANCARHFGVLGAPRILSRVHRVSTRQARLIGWQYNYPIGRQYNYATAWDYKCVWIFICGSSMNWSIAGDYGFINWVITDVHMMVTDKNGMWVIDKNGMRITDKRCEGGDGVSTFSGV